MGDHPFHTIDIRAAKEVNREYRNESFFNGQLIFSQRKIEHLESDVDEAENHHFAQDVLGFYAIEIEPFYSPHKQSLVCVYFDNV